MPGRSFNRNAYNYGHNGQLKDDEIFQGAYTAEYWEYDSRILRRWNIDPVVKPWESPYACFANNPIWFSDVKGDDATENGDKGKGQAPKVDNTPDPVRKPGEIWGDEVTVTDKHPGAQKVRDDFKKLGNWFKKQWDDITTRGNYGTGTGGNGGFSDGLKTMSNALAELAEMFGVLKPTNKDRIGTDNYKSQKTYNGDDGRDRSLEEAKSQGANETIKTDDKPQLDNSNAEEVENKVYETVDDATIFYIKKGDTEQSQLKTTKSKLNHKKDSLKQSGDKVNSWNYVTP